jgi:hypothetical protein
LDGEWDVFNAQHKVIAQCQHESTANAIRDALNATATKECVPDSWRREAIKRFNATMSEWLEASAKDDFTTSQILYAANQTFLHATRNLPTYSTPLNGIDAAGLADWLSRHPKLSIFVQSQDQVGGYQPVGMGLPERLAILTAAIQSYRPDSRVQRLVEAVGKYIIAFDNADKMHKNHCGSFTIGELGAISDLRAALTPWNGGK